MALLVHRSLTIRRRSRNGEALRCLQFCLFTYFKSDLSELLCLSSQRHFCDSGRLIQSLSLRKLFPNISISFVHLSTSLKTKEREMLCFTTAQVSWAYISSLLYVYSLIN